MAANDQVYNLVFPYVATPHAGARNVKDFPLPPGDYFDLRKDTTLFDDFAAIVSFRPTIGYRTQDFLAQVRYPRH